MPSKNTDMGPLLDFIARYESGGDYDRVWSGIRAKDYPPKRLTDMTIGEVLDWQDSIDSRYRSEAAGRYQFLEDTLRDIYSAAGLRLSSMFNVLNQDRLALHLMKRRGLLHYLRGDMTAEEFCNRLAHEWASLPLVSGPNKGRSVYDKDGLNSAHAKVGPFLKLVSDLGPGEQVPHYRPVPEEPVSGRTFSSFWQTILNALKRLFGRNT